MKPDMSASIQKALENQNLAGILDRWNYPATRAKAFEGITASDLEKIIVAYEPIWAIGTGKTATSEDANNSITEIRKEIEKNYGQEVSDRVIIQYGGSVKSSNAKANVS